MLVAILGLITGISIGYSLCLRKEYTELENKVDFLFNNSNIDKEIWGD